MLLWWKMARLFYMIWVCIIENESSWSLGHLRSIKLNIEQFIWCQQVNIYVVGTWCAGDTVSDNEVCLQALKTLRLCCIQFREMTTWWCTCVLKHRYFTFFKLLPYMSKLYRQKNLAIASIVCGRIDLFSNV